MIPNCLVFLDIIAIQMDALLQPVIIDRVFEFLQVLDIDRCQYVCQAWRESALRKLNKCPPIDRFESLVVGSSWHYHIEEIPPDDIPVTWEDFRMLRDHIIMENRKMNGVDFNVVEGLDYEICDHWFSKRMGNSRSMSRIEIDEAFQRFLMGDARCVPSITFVRYHEDFSHIVNGISFSSLTVLIKDYACFSYPEMIPDEIEKNIDAMSIAFEEVARGHYDEMRNVRSWSEGIHINRYIPGIKITVTDWSDPESARPIINDADFPIQAVIYLACQREHPREAGRIKEFFVDSKPIFSGGTLCSFRYKCDPAIFLADPEKRELKPALRITITFAGKDVRSAFHKFEKGPELERELEDFKSSLDFPIADGRVIAFLLDDDPFCHHPRSLSQLFPCVKLIKMKVSQVLEPIRFNRHGWTERAWFLHLIRI